MIKLVITDIDGTLVSEGTPELNKEYFDIILQLKEKGIVFVAASGRQYPSILNMFRAVQNEIIFVADNGAYITCRGSEILEAKMNREHVVKIVEEIRKTDNCEFMYETKYTAYTETKDGKFLDLLINGYHNEVECVEDVLKVEEDAIKISVYSSDEIEKIAAVMLPKWQEKTKAVIAGAYWLDFMEKSVDKGNALESIQKALNITEEETMAFGDNKNDIGMLKKAKESYAVSSASDEVKAAARHIAGDFHELGVLNVLKELLKNQEKI